MSVGARIVAFGAGLALLFGAALAIGGAVDPDVEAGSDEHGMTSEEETMEGHGTMAAGEVAGLATSAGGYRLAPAAMSAPAGARTPYEFSILGPGGEPVTDFDVEHEREMHLIVVRRDLAGFQHVHPELAADGSWHVELDTTLPGTYRVFADFTTGGEAMTLATDLSVAGDFEPRPLPLPERSADAGDGYVVRIDSARPEAGASTRVGFTIARNGQQIGGVQPYLGADGHLVVLREGDLAFLHAHPQGEPGGSGPIAFDVDYPSAGAYRMYLQFRHRGEVHTAEFTELVGGASPIAAGGQNGRGHGDDHAH
jgi:hypothetical protein